MGTGETRFEVAPGNQIDTREELIAALRLASEVEHLLLVQYLFSGLSLKKRPEGITEAQAESTRRWAGVILGIAREEMVHLATVSKLLVAVGGAPHLERPHFPVEAGAEFPFPMRLEPFSAAEIQRFVRFETPRSAPPHAGRYSRPPVREQGGRACSKGSSARFALGR